MSTSQDKRPGRRVLLRGAALFGGAVALCILFSQVYAVFGHRVRSAAMDWMFLYPLAGGVVALLLALLWPGAVGQRLWGAARGLFACGIAVLTMGSLLKGVFDIAGTASHYILYYRIAGGALTAAALVAGFVILVRGKM